MMKLAGPMLEVLAGEALPPTIREVTEPGPQNPLHRAVAFLHGWAATMDGVVPLENISAAVAVPVTGTIGGPLAPPEQGEQSKLAEADPNAGFDMEVTPQPEPLTVDGCPLSKVGHPRWFNRMLDGRPVMSPRELAHHLCCGVAKIHKMRANGEFPLPMVHYLGNAADPAVQKKRIAFYRDEARKFIAEYKGAHHA